MSVVGQAVSPAIGSDQSVFSSPVNYRFPFDPVKAIGQAADLLRVNPVFRRCPAWAAGDDHVIAGVKSFLRQTITDQPPAS
jgi:hypothetical protein